MKRTGQTLGALICACCLAGCAGPKVPAYKTKPQKFNWGKAYVWMSTVQGTQRSATTGNGYLLINMSYKKSVRNKNCVITVNHVSMKDPNSGVLLIEQTPSFKDGSPMTKNISEYKTGQFSLSGMPFEFDRDSFPYDLNIKMFLDCPNKKTDHSFSKKIEFRMVQPVIWMQ